MIFLGKAGDEDNYIRVTQERHGSIFYVGHSDGRLCHRRGRDALGIVMP